MKDSKDWIAPMIMAALAIVMYFMTNILKEMVEEAKQNELKHATPSKYTGPSRMETTIIDNFVDLKDPIVKRLQDKRLWEECNDGSQYEDGKYQWWDGKTEPKDIWQELAKRMWENRPEFNDAIGFEYWCNIMEGGKTLPWHIDKDEDAYSESYELVTPLKGSVYYGFDHDGKFDGGKLWLIDAQYEDNFELYETEWRDELVEIDANYNRVVYFNASLWHKVSTITSGARYTFAVNALDQIPRRIVRTNS